MKLAELTQPLAPKDRRKRSASQKAAPKKKPMLTDPEDTPQEPKHRVNTREIVRQHTSRDAVGKR